MTKDEFLLAMERALAPLPANERIDILSDYMEHFRAGEEQGKVDEEIAAGLGDPTVLARSYLEGREQSSTTAEERKAAETGAPASGAGVPSQTVPPQRTYPQGALRILRRIRRLLHRAAHRRWRLCWSCYSMFLLACRCSLGY